MKRVFETPTEFVDAIEISPTNYAYTSEPKKTALLGDEEAEEPDFEKTLNSKDAFVNAGSIQAFTSEVKDPSIKQMVLDSTLFAQLAANAKHERVVDPLGWYQRYQLVLTNLGWSISAFALIKQTFKSTRIDIADSAIDLMTRMLSGMSLEILEAALDSMRGMKNEDELIELFDGNSMSDTVANFQVGQASWDEDGNIAMPVGMFFFRTSHVQQGFLFFRWKRKHISLFGDTQMTTLNVAQYKLVQSVVAEKLAEVRPNLIRGIELDLPSSS